MSVRQGGRVESRHVTATLSLPPAQTYQPTTFRERGVAVPFTTPLLAGARVRRGDRDNIELIVPNPSGGRGVYILPWSSVCVLSRPTVHDSRLAERLDALAAVSPSTIRQAALATAAEGLAGAQAAEAALAALDMDKQDRLLTRFVLLFALEERAAPSTVHLSARRREASDELERDAHHLVALVAQRLERSPHAILTDLDALTEVFLPIGLEGQTSPARVTRLLDGVVLLSDELAAWVNQHRSDAAVELAGMIAGFAGFAIPTARSVLATARAMTRDPANLLRSWSRAPDRIIAYAERAEWLLDGWEQLCLLWRSAATPSQQHAITAEMAQLVPALPREVARWLDMPAAPDKPTASRPVVRFDRQADRTVRDLTARNERLRALAL
jgi:hypothetical protein